MTRNYLYCDYLSGVTRWLLASNASVILSHEDFSFPRGKGTLRCTSFVVAEKDTNNDGILSGSDLKTFAISQPNGASYTALIKDIEDVMESTLVEENKLIVFYRKDSGIFFATIDLKEMKVSSTSKIFQTEQSH